MFSCFLYLKCRKQRDAQTGSILNRSPMSVETYTDSLVAGPSSVPVQEHRGAREPPRLIHEAKVGKHCKFLDNKVGQYCKFLVGPAEVKLKLTAY